MFLRYIGKNISEAQINWGSHTDPTGLLVHGGVYETKEVDIHGSYTAIYLKGFGNDHFNSVWFEEDPSIR